MTPSRRPRRFAAAALLCALALGAGACGDEAEDTAPAASSSEPSEASGDAPAEKGAAPEAGDTVDIVDFQYEPGNLKAAVGAPITFTNKDDAPHTVTANDKSFDSGNMAKDDTFEHTFDKPGTYKYFCAIHNYMTGEVTVA